MSAKIMRTILPVLLLAGLTILLAACGGAAPVEPDPASPSDVNISLATQPDPPQTGPVELVVQVNDAGDQPVADADVFVFADHTDMKGMNMNGRATAQGNGRYAISADLSMSGNWKITVQVKKAPVDVAEEFNLAVQ